MVLFAGTPFELNRVMLIRILSVIVIIVAFSIVTRNLKIVPSRGQALFEFGLDFIRVGVAEELLGKKDGRRFLPLLTTFFFMILAMNFTGVVPFLNVAGTAVIGVPLLLAVIAYFTWIIAGIQRNGGLKFFRNALFPPGVPKGLYIIVTPIELISTFIVRPVTHTLRLLMNMIVGHLLLVLFFTATSFFFLEANGLFKLFGIGTIGFGLAFTVLELLVIVLQAYVFTILTAVYLQLALADEH
ncbi:MAG: atpB [Microbacteriaceae bacterium]|nr:atpB [Microbacteriaceae bacterium]